VREPPRPDDLRARMQRVATRPTPRRPAQARSVSAAEHPRPQAPSRAEAPEARAPRSRLSTLLAWAQWELAVVPEQRWRWLMALTRHDAEPPQRNHR
jgi:hypothetical protein